MVFHVVVRWPAVLCRRLLELGLVLLTQLVHLLDIAGLRILGLVRVLGRLGVSRNPRDGGLVGLDRVAPDTVRRLELFAQEKLRRVRGIPTHAGVDLRADSDRYLLAIHSGVEVAELRGIRAGLNLARWLHLISKRDSPALLAQRLLE